MNFLSKDYFATNYEIIVWSENVSYDFNSTCSVLLQGEKNEAYFPILYKISKCFFCHLAMGGPYLTIYFQSLNLNSFETTLEPKQFIASTLHQD
jgi:hypothetical protein